MTERLDEIDRRILYHLVRDARGTSAPEIAEEVSVSAGTVRNRIAQLEDAGIIRGYHADVDYERAESRLVNLFTCTVDVPDRERVAKQALGVRGVVHVRELMTGHGNLQITVVGEDTQDVSRIARELAALGVTIEDEDLVQQEHTRPYHQFGASGHRAHSSMTDLVSIEGDAEVVEVIIDETSPLAGRTIQEAAAAGVISDESLIVAVERDDEVLTPKGNTRIRADDVVTVFSRSGETDDVVEVAAGEN